MPELRQEIAKRLAGLKLAPAREAAIVEEVSQHLEDRYQELVSGGATEDEAHRVALEELSDADLLAKGLRHVEREAPQEPTVLGSGGGHNFLASLWQDIRYGLRQLRRSPGFTAVAVITLALGIGANTAMFSVIDGVLLRPLPYAHPSQLVSVRQRVGHVAGADLSYPNFFDWRSQNHVFSSIAAYCESDFTLTGVGQPVHLPGEIVTWDTFRLLGERPALGRGFLPQDEQAGSHEVLLSHRLWQSRFGSNPKVVGHAIALNGKSYTIRGVMPADFNSPSAPRRPNSGRLLPQTLRVSRR